MNGYPENRFQVSKFVDSPNTIQNRYIKLSPFLCLLIIISVICVIAKLVSMITPKCGCQQVQKQLFEIEDNQIFKIPPIIQHISLKQPFQLEEETDEESFEEIPESNRIIDQNTWIQETKPVSIKLVEEEYQPKNLIKKLYKPNSAKYTFVIQDHAFLSQKEAFADQNQTPEQRLQSKLVQL